MYFITAYYGNFDSVRDNVSKEVDSFREAISNYTEWCSDDKGCDYNFVTLADLDKGVIISTHEYVAPKPEPEK